MQRILAAAVVANFYHRSKLSSRVYTLSLNEMIYFVHYSGHLDQMETMTNLGDITQLSMLELSKHTPGLDAVTAAN